MAICIYTQIVSLVIKSIAIYVIDSAGCSHYENMHILAMAFVVFAIFSYGVWRSFFATSIPSCPVIATHQFVVLIVNQGYAFAAKATKLDPLGHAVILPHEPHGAKIRM
jgi:membrane-bound metal-dependent hydrolase YbcI (DUF457 family)